MSWLFSQALVEAFSGESSSDGEPCAPLSVMPTPHKFYRLDKMMEPSNLSRFGLMCAVLTEDRGLELLMSYLAAFPARTFPAQAAEQGSRGNDLDSGLNLPGSFVRFDPSSSSWKTAQCSLLGDSDEFSGTWPRWGSGSPGGCWALTMWQPPINENGSGFWPTPRATDGSHGGPNQRGSKGDLMLSSAVHQFATPCSADAHGAGPNQNTKTLGRQIKREAQFPTPTATNTKANHMRGADRGKPREPRSYFLTPRATDTGKGEGSETFVKRMGDRTEDCFQSLPSQVGGQLNPPWVEWLMGWPIGWTDLKPLETARSHKWPHSHSEPSTAA